MAQAKKKASKSTANKVTVQTVDSTKTINELIARVDRLEAGNKRQIKAFKFAANEVRPLYGMGALAMVFDAIVEGLEK